MSSDFLTDAGRQARNRNARIRKSPRICVLSGKRHSIGTNRNCLRKGLATSTGLTQSLNVYTFKKTVAAIIASSRTNACSSLLLIYQPQDDEWLS